MASRRSILEIQDGGLTWTVIDGSHRAPKIISCEREKLVSLSAEHVAAALTAVSERLGGLVGPVDVAIGDRCCQQFKLEVPNLTRSDLYALADREARRLGSVTADVKMLIGLRHLGRKQGIYHYDVVAAPSHVWSPIAVALAELEVEVGSLTSLEDAIAEILRGSFPPDAAILEVSAGRAHFIGCLDNAPSKVRRFLIQGGIDSHQDPGFIATQLALEIPRTLDHLFSGPEENPETLVVSHLLGWGETELEIISSDFKECLVFEPQVQSLVEAQPGLATFGLLARRRRGMRFTIGDEGDVRLPAKRGTVVAMTACVIFGGASAFLAIREHLALRKLHTRAEAVMRRVAELEEQESELRSATSSPEKPSLELKLRRLMGERRPVSLMISEVVNSTFGSITLQEFDYSAKTGVLLTGQLAETSRLRSLATMRDFKEKLSRLPYVIVSKEEIDPNSSATNLGFKVGLTWRAR